MLLSNIRISSSILFLLVFAIVSIPNMVHAQVSFKGRVVYRTDKSPAAFATIEVVNRKDVHTVTNFAGNFSLQIPNSKGSDTVVISSVGYQTIRLPLYIAAKRSEFVLTEVVKNMAGVTLRPLIIGSTSETVGYYRSWNDKHTGGEIGRIFKLPYAKFKLDKVRFKAGNSCDTCMLRIHIRKVVDGLPAEEILPDSISILVKKLSLDTKISEFDLTDYDLTITEKEFFVGIEVLNCSNGKNGSCAFNFAGTDKGEYFYKARNGNEWKATNEDEYTIYLKLFLRF
ncbi:MAG: carboxypeptidase-like regulatory domain-containing protein [Ferruginibacter sp.]